MAHDARNISYLKIETDTFEHLVRGVIARATETARLTRALAQSAQEEIERLHDRDGPDELAVSAETLRKNSAQLFLHWINMTAAAGEMTALDRVFQNLDLYDDEGTGDELGDVELERDALQDEPADDEQTET